MTSSQNAGAILMLDDEFDIVNIFTLALEKRGFHVIGFTHPHDSGFCVLRALPVLLQRGYFLIG
jgi:hypothetical protein